MEQRAAVVIGINYTNFPAAVPEEAQARAGVRALRYAEADATAMTIALETAGYNVATLVGPAATRRAILAAIRRQGQLAGRDGLLLVHFSGHGTMDPADPDTAYLLPVDAEPEELAGTAIPLDELARHLGGVQHAVTLLDCCHSGYAVGYREGTARGADAGADRGLGYRFQQGAQAAFRSVRGRVVLAACAGTQQAREFPRLGHGAFTYYALQCWQTDPEALDDSALFSGIDAGLQQEGLPRPVYGGVKEGRIILRDPAPDWEPGTIPALTLHPAAAQRRALLARLNALDAAAFAALLYTLGVDYAALPGPNRRAKTLQLLLGLDQVGQFPTLAQAVQDLEDRQAEEAAGTQADAPSVPGEQATIAPITLELADATAPPPARVPTVGPPSIPTDPPDESVLQLDTGTPPVDSNMAARSLLGSQDASISTRRGGLLLAKQAAGRVTTMLRPLLRRHPIWPALGSGVVLLGALLLALLTLPTLNIFPSTSTRTPERASPSIPRPTMTSATQRVSPTTAAMVLAPVTQTPDVEVPTEMGLAPSATTPPTTVPTAVATATIDVGATSTVSGVATAIAETTQQAIAAATTQALVALTQATDQQGTANTTQTTVANVHVVATAQTLATSQAKASATIQARTTSQAQGAAATRAAQETTTVQAVDRAAATQAQATHQAQDKAAAIQLTAAVQLTAAAQAMAVAVQQTAGAQAALTTQAAQAAVAVQQTAGAQAALTTQAAQAAHAQLTTAAQAAATAAQETAVAAVTLTAQAAEAASQATASTQAAAAAAQQTQAAQRVNYGPVSGELEPSGKTLAYYDPHITIDNFVAEATFVNPANHTSWQYNMFIRENGKGGFRLNLTYWESASGSRVDPKTYWSITHDTLLKQGADLRTGLGETNSLKVIADGSRGQLFINGNFIDNLDFSVNQDPGNFRLGVFTLDDGMKVGFENFTIRAYP